MLIYLVYTLLLINVKPSEKVYECYEVDSVPMPSMEVIPAFPEDLKDGVYIFKVVVDTSGNIIDYEAPENSDKAIISTFQAMKQIIKFTPGYVGNRKVPVRTTLTVTVGPNTPRYSRPYMPGDSVKLLLTFKNEKLLSFQDLLNKFKTLQDLKKFLISIKFTIKRKDSLNIFLFIK
ncbi:MAG TPA: hypothetical protein ENL43_00380 [candidate division WOR-3 bacterium]|uniref:TonB C-terminal domain-containing protein n=1 Tax=candidate division WOR-3 bacterium TaxID=2052148 RepID=A0A7V5HM68_UNCW3|nr:hypothetical protein [candidate division WOR-3 bacterium]